MTFSDHPLQPSCILTDDDIGRDNQPKRWKSAFAANVNTLDQLGHIRDNRESKERYPGENTDLSRNYLPLIPLENSNSCIDVNNGDRILRFESGQSRFKMLAIG